LRVAVHFALVGAFLFVSTGLGQTPARSYIGAASGITTLSADGASRISASSSQISSYKPENGATLRLFAGRHLSEHLTLEGSYGWNRNALLLTSVSVNAGSGETTYEQERGSSQHHAGGGLLLYFRNRSSWARPYLAFEGGLLRFSSAAGLLRTSKGEPALPPQRYANSTGFLRTTVGIDLHFRKGWAFRYSFGETLSRNPIGAQLQPRGSRGLAGFQNLWGVLRTF